MTDEVKMVVNYLQKVDKKMADAMYYGRPDKDVSRQATDIKWNNTVWHEIIIKEIEELTTS